MQIKTRNSITLRVIEPLFMIYTKIFTLPTKTFVFQKSYYFDYLKTNCAMDNPNAAKTLREELHGTGHKLLSLKSSPLVNHLGFNILIFSKGGDLIVQRRTKNVLVRPDELCSSGSGAINFNDVENNSLKQKSFDQIHITREVEEELGWEVADSIKGKLKLLGLTRELIRGGKPELFFSAISTLNTNEIQKCYKKSEGKKQQLESKELITFNISPYHYKKNPELENKSKSGEFKESFTILLNNIGKTGKISIPLLTNLVLWYKYKVNGNI